MHLFHYFFPTYTSWTGNLWRQICITVRNSSNYPTSKFVEHPPQRFAIPIKNSKERISRKTVAHHGSQSAPFVFIIITIHGNYFFFFLNQNHNICPTYNYVDHFYCSDSHPHCIYVIKQKRYANSFTVFTYLCYTSTHKAHPFPFLVVSPF